MSSIQRIPGTIVALSPIQHGGDEKTGSTPVLRSLTHWDSATGQHVRLPMFSGNAIRGIMRRLLMRDMCERLSYEVKSPKMHHALYTGGVLEGTDEAAGFIDLAFRTQVRDTIPPLALLGSAVGNQMIQGCLRVDHALPICREYAALLPHVEDARKEQSIRTFTDVAFATRRDDLRAERGADEQAQQMKVEFEVFISGTAFSHAWTLAWASDVEASCLGHGIGLLASLPYVGGKSSSGYGHVAYDYPTAPSPEAYLAYLDEHKDRIVQALDDLAMRLDGKRKVA
jgi:hypothetical protein